MADERAAVGLHIEVTRGGWLPNSHGCGGGMWARSTCWHGDFGGCSAEKAAEPGFEAQIFDAEGDEDLRSPYLPCMTSAAFLIDDLTPPWLQSDYNIQ